MTNDTKGALEVIEPIAHELNIEVRADDYFLYCNDQAIGIGCNSTYATIKEFIGYVMIWLCERENHRYNIPDSLAEQIKRYWK